MNLLMQHGKALVLVSLFAFVGSLILYKLTIPGHPPAA